MRIGIHLANASKFTGGQWTFEFEIARAIAAQKSAHELFVVTPKGSASLAINLPRLDYDTALSSVDKAVAWGRRKLIGYVPVGHGRPARHGLNRTLTATSIDLLWLLVPTCPAIPVIPFGITIMDLQHRKQPFFPEVSALREGMEWRSREEFYGEFARRAAFLVAGTRTGAAEVERFYGVEPRRIRVLPYPTPAFALDSSVTPTAPAGLTLPERFLFCPAGFNPHKNHVGLLHALKRLRDRHGLQPDVVCSGFDYGNRAHVLRVARELQVESQFHAVGFLEVGAIKYLYGKADAVVFPSLFGPDNLPPLEAMAVGTPVLCHHWDGADEQLGDAALIVNTADEAAFANALERILTDPSYANALRARGEILTQQRTVSDYAKSLNAIWDEFAVIRRCWGSQFA